VSVLILSRAVEVQGLAASEKLVLLILANFADDGGRCWPSVATIARKANLTERGSRRIIRRLEEAGHIRTEYSRGRTSNRYVVLSNPEGPAGLSTPNPEPDAGSNPEARSAFKPPTRNAGAGQPGTAVPPNRQEPSDDDDGRRASASFLEQVRRAANAPATQWWEDSFAAPVVNRWLGLPLSETKILAVIRSAGKGRTPNSPTYFNRPMQEAAGVEAVPPLSPVPPARGPRPAPTGNSTASIRKRYGVET
jgi:hypothetical protein